MRAETRAVRRRAAALAVAATLLAPAACGSGGDAPSSGADALVPDITVGGEDDGKHGSVLVEPYALPDVTLTATDGRPVSLASDLDAAVTLVFFGYTRCPDICQLVMGSIASATARLDPAVADQVDVVFVTTDPARDDEAALRGYLDRLDPSFEGLTGDLGTITEAATALGVPIEEGPRLPSGGYEVQHGTQVVGVDRAGRGTIVWTEGTAPAQFAEDVAELVAEAS